MSCTFDIKMQQVSLLKITEEEEEENENERLMTKHTSLSDRRSRCLMKLNSPLTDIS